MVPSYLPAADPAFDAMTQNFSALITATPATYGLVVGDATAIAAVVDPFHTAYLAAVNPVTRTSVTIAAKDAARTACDPVVRSYAQQIAKNPAVANSDKTALGLNLPNATRPRIPPPTTQPALSLVSAVHNLQTIAYYDTSTPTTKAMPPGAVGIDLRIFTGVGPLPLPDTLPPFGVITKSPSNIGTLSSDIGKTNTYWGRWMTRSGAGGQATFGPWSAPLSVAVL